ARILRHGPSAAVARPSARSLRPGTPSKRSFSSLGRERAAFGFAIQQTGRARRIGYDPRDVEDRDTRRAV
ncbi:MAG: hypothetical protein AVDCRST_MAG02-801, partial [uncultured Rubrobacteraceae bacterium]